MNTPIGFVCISCHRHDVHFARAAIASVRYYAPDVRIVLIKDLIYGDFPIWDMRQIWGCEVLQTTVKKFGWGFAKLEPLFLPKPGRFFVMDTDVLWFGDMRLISDPADFIVDEEMPSAELVATNYYDLKALETFDPAFHWPGFTFNTGQWIGTCGLLTRNDFSRLLAWSEPRGGLREDIFRLGEQGLQNYLFQKLSAEGRFVLKRSPIMRVGDTEEVSHITIADVEAGRDFRFVAHWCGLKRERFQTMHRGDLWLYFQKRHYDRLKRGRLLLFIRERARHAESRIRPMFRGIKHLFTRCRLATHQLKS